MKVTVDLIKENGFRIKTDQDVFRCDATVGTVGRPKGLRPVELFMAALGLSIATSAVDFCSSRSLSAEGLKIGLDWEYAVDSNRIARIDVSIHRPEVIDERLDDDFMCTIHTCDVYQTLQSKPEIHYHETSDVEKPEGEALIHFVGAE